MSDIEAKLRQTESELETYKEKFNQIEKEYSDFERDSKELEEHLESEVSRLEDEKAALVKKMNILKSELQDSKEKQIESDKQYQTRLQSLENELDQEKKKLSEMQSKLVNLEQENEDLNRLYRQLEADLTKSQDMADKALEENAVLQTDLDELKQLSRETMQRMTEELRELASEKDMLERKVASSKEAPQNVQPEVQEKIQENNLQNVTAEATLNKPSGSSIRRKDLLDTLTAITGLAKALEQKLTPQSVK